MRLWEIMAAIEQLYPLSWAESWDRVGLQMGDPEADIERVLLCLDVDMPAVSNAVANACGLICSHHPLLFDPLHAIDESVPKGRLVSRIIRERLAVYSAHTNLDRGRIGVADQLAICMGLHPGAPVAPFPTDQEITQPDVRSGYGRVCTSQPGTRMSDLEERARQLPGFTGAHRNYRTDAPAGVVAVMGGSFPDEWLYRLPQLGIDTLVIGEIGYHEMQELGEHGIRTLAIGHDVSEHPVLEALSRFLAKRIPQVGWLVHRGLPDVSDSVCPSPVTGI